MNVNNTLPLPVSLLHDPTPLRIWHYVHTFVHYMGSGFIMRLAFSVNVLITTGVPHSIVCTCLEKRDREWEHFHLAKSDTNLCQSSEPYFGAYSCNCYLLVCFCSLHTALFYIYKVCINLHPRRLRMGRLNNVGSILCYFHCLMRGGADFSINNLWNVLVFFLLHSWDCINFPGCLFVAASHSCRDPREYSRAAGGVLARSLYFSLPVKDRPWGFE